jgi:hypothetical protein
VHKETERGDVLSESEEARTVVGGQRREKGTKSADEVLGGGGTGRDLGEQ